MGDAAGQSSNSLHLMSLVQLFFQLHPIHFTLFALGNIVGNALGADEMIEWLAAFGIEAFGIDQKKAIFLFPTVF